MKKTNAHIGIKKIIENVLVSRSGYDKQMFVFLLEVALHVCVSLVS